MTQTALAPLVVGPGEDRAPLPLALTGHRLIFKAMGADTGGQFTAGLLIAPPLTGPPLHVHTREDEWFYVLKGELWFQVEDRFIKAGPGTAVFAPRDIPHTWQNFGPETVEALGLITPSNFEGFFIEAMEAGGDPAVLGAISERYGAHLVGPPMTQIPRETGR